jgi:hypothetical protein
MAQARASRSKTDQVIRRRTDYLKPTRLLPALGQDPEIRAQTPGTSK